MTGDDLRSAREAKGWTIREAAKSIGCSKAFLSQWENGKAFPKKKWWPKIELAYGLSMTPPPQQPTHELSVNADWWTLLATAQAFGAVADQCQFTDPRQRRAWVLLYDCIRRVNDSLPEAEFARVKTQCGAIARKLLETRPDEGLLQKR